MRKKVKVYETKLTFKPEGLRQVSAFIPDDPKSAKKHRAYCKRLRKEAGTLLPRDE